MRGKLETLDQITEALTHDGLTPDDLRRILTALVVIVARIAELEVENERLRADVTALLTGDAPGDMVEYGTGSLTVFPVFRPLPNPVLHP